MHSQEEMKQMVLPLLKTKGKVYQKVKKVFARKAKSLEQITQNFAQDMFTKNVQKRVFLSTNRRGESMLSKSIKDC